MEIATAQPQTQARVAVRLPKADNAGKHVPGTHPISPIPCNGGEIATGCPSPCRTNRPAISDRRHTGSGVSRRGLCPLADASPGVGTEPQALARAPQNA